MDAVVTPDRDAEGNAVLRRALTLPERQAISARAAQLSPWMKRGSTSKVVSLITEMLSGFGGSQMSLEEASAVASQYAAVVSGLPLWAIERACMRFAGGEVSAAEVGAKMLDRSFRPSSAQLNIVASKMANQVYDEVSRLSKIARGTVALRHVPPEERERVQAKLDELLGTLRAKGENFDKAGAESRTAEAAKRSEALALREYRAAGLEPVRSSDGMIISLSMLRSIGWIVEEVDGHPALIAPPKPETRRPTARDMGT